MTENQTEKKTRKKTEKKTKTKPKPDINKPISMWGYFGLQLLFSLPVIGLAALILISISAKNINVRNYACSFYCTLILTVAICVVILALGGWTILSGILLDALTSWAAGL